MRSIVDRIFVAVRAAAQVLDRAEGEKVESDEVYRDRLIGISIVFNAALTGMALRQLLADVIQRVKVVSVFLLRCQPEAEVGNKQWNK